MNKRELLAATAAGTVLLAMHRMTPTLAQEADTTPEAHELQYDGQIVKASRSFTADGFRMTGAITINTIAAVFDIKRNAENAFETAAQIPDKLLESAQAEGTNMTILNREDVSPPKLGKKRHAESIDYDIEGLQVKGIFLRVQKDELLHVWTAVGFASPAEELFDLSAEHMKFEDVDVEDDDELLELLPELDDLPSGFAMTDEKITRENEGEGNEQTRTLDKRSRWNHRVKQVSSAPIVS